MTNPVVAPLVRRAILELITDIGGEHNHETLALLVNQMGHRVASSDVRSELAWLAKEGLVHIEEVGPFTVARILADGRDIAQDRLTREGVWRFRLGE